MFMLSERCVSSRSACCSGRDAQLASRGRRNVPAVVCRMGRSGLEMGPGGGGQASAEADPEGLYKGLPQMPVIQRRMMKKQMEVDKEFAKAMNSASDELRKEALLRRETRRVPGTHEELVEYFLNTLAEDLEFEVARYRPRMTADFFKYLDDAIGNERFSAKPDEEKLGELDLLRKYLEQASAAVDACVGATVSAADRLKTLLASKDKKATILEMAAANQIDPPLMDLLDQNIAAARNAEQEDAAKFMEKVKQACSKYLMTGAGSAQGPVLPAPPSDLRGKALGAAKEAEVTTASGLILPGSSSSGSSSNTNASSAPGTGGGGLLLR